MLLKVNREDGKRQNTCPRSGSMRPRGGETSLSWRCRVGVVRCFSEDRFWSRCGASDLQVNLCGPLSPAGRDASRAFVTGDHSAAGLVDDVSDLSFSELLTLQNWLSFYEKNYEFVGRYSTGHFRRFSSAGLQFSKGLEFRGLDSRLKSVKYPWIFHLKLWWLVWQCVPEGRGWDTGFPLS